MERKRLKYLITNLFAGPSTISERADVAKWLDSDDAECDSSDAWENASNDIESSLKNEIWNNIQPQIKATKPAPVTQPSKYFSYRYLKVAALIAVILCSTFTLYMLFNNIIRHNASAGENIYCFEVKAGEKGSMRLSDGTMVHLNSASKISFAGDYNSENRIVNLEGEAYFDVAKNPNKKFIVSCNGLEVEALGTEFNVKAYPSDSIITTSLAQGKVKVSSKEQCVTLLPNDVATYNLKRHTIKASTIDDISIANYWRSGQLVFNSEPLSSIAKTIERMYGVKINIKDAKLKEMRFTGTIQNSSLNNVMHVISLSYPLSYSINDSVITILANDNKIKLRI
ncbi:MAG: DUF4974 domain-containing protein [Muribaculaceae bacterium]